MPAAYGQEVAMPGLVADFRDDSDTIVVTALRPDTLPLPYESVMEVRPVTFTVEQGFSGRTHFVYTRRLFDLGEGMGIEFHREWSDGHGFETIPEKEPPDFRLVWRR